MKIFFAQTPYNRVSYDGGNNQLISGGILLTKTPSNHSDFLMDLLLFALYNFLLEFYLILFNDFYLTSFGFG